MKRLVGLIKTKKMENVALGGKKKVIDQNKKQVIFFIQFGKQQWGL